MRNFSANNPAATENTDMVSVINMPYMLVSTRKSLCAILKINTYAVVEKEMGHKEDKSKFMAHPLCSCCGRQKGM